MGSGVSMVESIYSAAETTNNKVVVEKMGVVAQGVKGGRTLTGELTKADIYPYIMLSMVGIGEETGAIDTLMQKTADYYEEELNASVSKLLSMLEPIMILFLAVFVGFMLVALMVPMLTMVTAV
jgi:type IV pilus assembly protein PilC